MSNDVVAMITTLVSSVGFPIVCCFMLFKQNNELRESIDKLKEVIDKVLDKLNG